MGGLMILAAPLRMSDSISCKVFVSASTSYMGAIPYTSASITSHRGVMSGHTRYPATLRKDSLPDSRRSPSSRKCTEVTGRSSLFSNP